MRLLGQGLEQTWGMGRTFYSKLTGLAPSSRNSGYTLSRSLLRLLPANVLCVRAGVLRQDQLSWGDRVRASVVEDLRWPCPAQSSWTLFLELLLAGSGHRVRSPEQGAFVSYRRAASGLNYCAE